MKLKWEGFAVVGASDKNAERLVDTDTGRILGRVERERFMHMGESWRTYWRDKVGHGQILGEYTSLEAAQAALEKAVTDQSRPAGCFRVVNW